MHVAGRSPVFDVDTIRVANCLHQQLPEDSFGGVHAAVALFRLGRTNEAKALTLPLLARFPQELGIPYNLACYCAQLGEIGKRTARR